MSCPEAIRGQPIFRDEEDRGIFLDISGEASERFEIEIHAYALMAKRLHFLVVAALAGRKLKKIMGGYI